MGKTTQYMHLQNGGHRSEVMNQSSELGEHFYKCGLEEKSLQIIDCVNEGEDFPKFIGILNLVPFQHFEEEK